ncbi:MAG: SoxR reducing system RseC family protein [Thermodesulfobacteriota bacterium]
MATETGIVTQIKGEYAVVKTQRAAGCGACTEKDTCHSMGGGKEIEFTAINAANAGAGDQVVLNFKTSRMLKLSMLIYIFPILALVTGAVIGNNWAISAGTDPSVGAAVPGFLAFFAAIGIILFLEKGAKHSDRYKPVIVSVKKAGGSDSGTASGEGAGFEKCHA